MTRTRKEALRQAEAAFAAGGVPDPALDAQWLLADVCCVERLPLLLALQAPLSEEQDALFCRLCARRAAGEPLQYVLGKTDFMGHTFRCDVRALIPRCDTETLCEAVIARTQAPGTAVLELGAGSGAVSVSVSLACPGARVAAVERSALALSLCRENAQLHGVRVEWVEGDWLEAVAGRQFDVVFSNPPYIPRGELDGLQAEVRREPCIALDGGQDGLDFYRRTANGLGQCLRTGGSLLLEVGDGQAERVCELLQGRFARLQVLNDVSGLPRVVIGDGYDGNAGSVAVD